MKTYEERMQSVQQKLQHKQGRRRALMATAGVLCLCIIAGIVLPYFKDDNDIQMYADSDYFKIIEAINRDFPKREENFWTELDGILDADDLIYGTASPEAGGMDGAVQENNAPTASPDMSEDINGSVEITDHQVAGVLEADIIKRSQAHIFYLNGNTLEVYPIAGLDTKRIGTWCLNTKEDVYYYSNTEMYLSADASRINLVVSGFGNMFENDKKSAFVQVISLDVTDPANIKEANCLYVTGSLLSSRMVGDQMLLMAQYRMDNKVDFEDESTFLPQYGVPENMQSVPADNIVVPEKLSDKTYTVVTLLDGKDMSILDSGAFMSYSTELYVSTERIYATRTYTEEEEIDKSNAVNKQMTQISCMAYGDSGLKPEGTFCVEGTVKNQYSMDEYGGIFRIVTATSRRNIVIYESGNQAMSATKRNANLTCFKVGTWEQVAQVAQFAPEGETVESVRFDGDYAYVCTAVVVTLTDPVFFFDMTDLNNIIVKDTGTIEGYSSSLIQLNDGYLMGIGFDDQRDLKVEIYEETENGVASVCDIIYHMNFASEYKAYYIDRENNLFGIPVQDGYVLLQFDGYQLHQVAKAVTLGAMNDTRGVVIDGYLYVLSPNYFDVLKIA